MAADPRYRVGLAGLTPEQLGEKMREAIAAVERIIPGATIAIFAFSRPPETGMSYIASGNREDIAAAVGEWAARINPRSN